MQTKPKWLEQIRMPFRALHDNIRTAQAYVDWARRFVVFPN
jgi:hypothetical protein